ncbi:MAG TPA: restriction endonuclease subunit S [Ignavibacteriaceae bacterium]|nr:restriction endonuclease subunit S [Ignavibacteriaceae bacterium]
MEDFSLKKIDKSNWKEYRFDEIAFNISERVEPTTTDLEIYVGLEHLDPESIHIKRFGKRTDVKGTKLKVYPGDIIFGRRRAYQRKAAITNFEGFCSAHALVLRANPKVIEPKLFPFFLHSDSFMNRAVEISVGSLSPTINWGTLKKEKFLLPPKIQQSKIAELLWAADQVISTSEKVFELINQFILIRRRSLFKTVVGKNKSIDSLINKSEDYFVGKLEQNEYKDTGKYPIIDQSQKMIAGYTDYSDLVFNGSLPVIVFGDHTTVLKYIDFPFVLGADGTKVLSQINGLNVKYFFYAL